MTKNLTTDVKKNYKSHQIDNSDKDEFLPITHRLRREILTVLKDEDQIFTNLFEKINKNRKEKISESSLHQHLEVLVNGKFVRRFRETGHTCYVLNPDKLEELSPDI